MTLFSTLFAAKAQQTDVIKILSVSEFKEAIENNNVQLFDVRTAQEFTQGAIKKARNLDFYQQEKFNSEFKKLDKEAPIYLYCRSGNRSQKAARKLKAMGFTEIYDLKGGILNYK